MNLKKLINNLYIKKLMSVEDIAKRLGMTEEEVEGYITNLEGIKSI